MRHETCYVSCNCNQTPTAVHWGKNNLICYASCNSVLIYDPQLGSGGKVISTLVQHKGRVNSVKWIKGVSFEMELISGSSDGTAIVWSKKEQGYIPFMLQGHDGVINVVDGLYKGPDTNNAIIVTASVDATVKIWYRLKSADDFVPIQKLFFNCSICVGLAISFLPDESQTVILACAVDSCIIHLYVENEHKGEIHFKTSASLAGHEDWVRGLDFVADGKGDFMLASASQDYYIRLWRITTTMQNPMLLRDCTTLVKRSNDKEFHVFVDSILTGHEGWIYSVNWSPKNCQLLSSSLDKSMMIWELDPDSNLWLEKIRVGEIGGNTLGFYGGLFSPDGKSILAHSYHGAFHIWNVNDAGYWEPSVTIGGHFREVADLAWEPQGEFVVSVSADQTTRVHAPWPRLGVKPVTWHEIARPQVHGYDLSSVALLSRYKMASSAEEKIIRTFEAPQNFVENFHRICRPKMEDTSIINDDCGPKGASVPSLGLSNKAIFANDNNENQMKNDKDPYPLESHFTAMTLTEPPTEETLLENTLWPEIQKLYGHGYELYSLAASPDGQFLASACKATTPEHAAVLLWETTNWKLVQKLPSHTLTVVQIAFSPDSQHILTVSRDRRWSLFSKNSSNQFDLAATTDKTTSIHSRIIWCCAWSHDSKYFATGSRDGKLVLWTKHEGKMKLNCLGEYGAVSDHLTFSGESVTAVAFAPVLVSNSYLLAIGLESGVVYIYKWLPDKGWMKELDLNTSLAHHLTVRRLAFRPVIGEAGEENIDENVLQLASCGADYSVKVHNFIVN